MCLGAPGYFSVAIVLCVLHICAHTCTSNLPLTQSGGTGAPGCYLLSLFSGALFSRSSSISLCSRMPCAAVRAPLSRYHNDLVTSFLVPVTRLSFSCGISFLNSLPSWVPLTFSASFISLAQHPLALPFTPSGAHVSVLPCPQMMIAIRTSILQPLFLFS